MLHNTNRKWYSVSKLCVFMKTAASMYKRNQFIFTVIVDVFTYELLVRNLPFDDCSIQGCLTRFQRQNQEGNRWQRENSNALPCCVCNFKKWTKRVIEFRAGQLCSYYRILSRIRYPTSHFMLLAEKLMEFGIGEGNVQNYWPCRLTLGRHVLCGLPQDFSAKVAGAELVPRILM